MESFAKYFSAFTNIVVSFGNRTILFLNPVMTSVIPFLVSKSSFLLIQPTYFAFFHSFNLPFFKIDGSYFISFNQSPFSFMTRNASIYSTLSISFFPLGLMYEEEDSWANTIHGLPLNTAKSRGAFNPSIQ